VSNSRTIPNSPDKFAVGTVVTVDHAKYPGLWTVQSNGPVNATLSPVAGGRGLRVPHTMLREAPKGENGAIVTTIPVADTVFFSEGEIVRVASGKYAGLYVVIKDNGSDRINLARFGGDDGRYLRVSRGGVSKIDAALVTSALAILEGN
jgi:hypothetical protein